MSGHHDNHGSTPAAWTATVIAIIGAIISGVGMMMVNWTVFGLGFGVVFAGLAVGKVMGEVAKSKASTGAR